MSTNQFKPGDLVYLKSGGPAMTVEAVNEKGDIACHWFKGASRPTGLFNPVLLKQADGKAK